MPETKFTKEFREAVLALFVQDPAFLKEASGVIKPEHFEERIHVFAADFILKSFLKTNQPPSRPMLMNELMNALFNDTNVKDLDTEQKLVLKPAEDFITKIFEPVPMWIADVKAKYLDFAKNQEMKNEALKIYHGIDSGELDYNQAMSDLRKTYLKVSGNDESSGVDFFADLPEIEDIMKSLRQKVYPTGFAAMDKAMDGGLTSGTLTVFIAPPKGGKSMVLVNSGVANLHRGKKVVEFTLEISARKLQRRYLSRISGVPMKEMNLRMQEVQSKCADFWANTEKRYGDGKGARLFIKEYPTGSASVATFRSYLYRLQAQQNIAPDIIIVDYGDIVRSSAGKYNDERFEQKASYEEMRALANEFNCPVITASQVNRQAVNKALIKMDDIAEAFAKVQVADHIISICQTDIEAAEKVGRLYLAGSREAQAGTTSKIHMNWDTCQMIEDEFRMQGKDPIWDF